MYHRLSLWIARLARLTAYAGGLSLMAVIALTCLSIAGRALDGLGFGPIPGDIELVEFGIGFAVFSAMPYAQFARAHARVDLFKPLLGQTINRLLDLIGDLFLLGFSALIAWRLWLGMIDKGAYHETSFILQIPVVWGYRAAMATCVVAVIVALFSVLRSTRALLLPPSMPHATET
ncbi:TRAP transporter small permease [Celeribacter baekdonensis]|uniref:TRAP transporter small permease protein n=1 Tax=Celeribacter baekdonensis TaxID=875171 RepID=A0A2R4M1Z0_9RHOB|nr:TRAP transporter small permease [Celeribacter baekdonensis]AVW91224.1 TRAP transporter small permease [Celeribacter baekdonensis]